jgi:hypothetical protein
MLPDPESSGGTPGAVGTPDAAKEPAYRLSGFRGSITSAPEVLKRENGMPVLIVTQFPPPSVLLIISAVLMLA